MDYIADATFVIDLWREQGKAGGATRFAQAHPDASIGMSWIAKAEFLRGAVYAGHKPGIVDAFIDRFPTVFPEETTIRFYALLYVELKTRNSLLGPNDLWIAASARQKGLPLLTRNAKEFSRVPDLAVIDYTASVAATPRRRK